MKKEIISVFIFAVIAGIVVGTLKFFLKRYWQLELGTWILTTLIVIPSVAYYGIIKNRNKK